MKTLPSISKKHRRRKQDIPRCLSCGTTANMARRRYCSIACRQRLRFCLNLHTGLLRALNTRYATFYFTDTVIVLDVLTHNSVTIASFLYLRTPNDKPANDFCRLADELGGIWWNEKRRSNKRYLAARQVIARSQTRQRGREEFQPDGQAVPAVRSGALICLELTPRDLSSDNAVGRVKQAFRRQAKTVHPDMGGDNAAFRRLRKAYQELLDWTDNPTFTKRRGFVDRWFYDSSGNRWIQPAPIRR
jgi:hypothetical protein